MLVKHLRGSTQKNNNLLLPEGFITIDSTLNTIRLHDGVTNGGNALSNIVALDGPSSLTAEIPGTYRIVNYDSFTEYRCEVDVGTVTLEENEITIIAPPFTPKVILTVWAGTVGQRIEIPAEFDGITGTLTELASGPSRQSFFGGVINGKIYVFGGYTNTSNGNPSNALFMYDPDIDTWEQVANTNTPPAMAGSNDAVYDGRLYIFAKALDTIYIYDPITSDWTTRTIPTEIPLDFLAQKDRYVYAYSPGPDVMVKYDLLEDEWTVLPAIGSSQPANFERRAAQIVGNLYCLHGGYSNRRTTDRYDLTTNEWIGGSPGPRGRFSPGSIAVGDRIFISGGEPSPTGTILSPIDVYYPLEDRWGETYGGVRRTRHRMWNIGNKIYIHGGMQFHSTQGMRGNLFVFT